MAVQPIYYGAGLVRVAAGSDSLADLGYSADGVRISYRGYWLDVPSDRSGGEAGPPRDVQFMGVTADIICELTEFDATEAAKIQALVAGATLGTYADSTIGTLMRTDSNKTYRILVNSTTVPFNFPTCIIRNAWEINKGTKHARFIFTAEAHRWGSSGLLMNNTTS